ncbi:hypothetical protein MH117_04940 [Paenibacillus sp. ACRRX]|uniref:hypothetical protein n=1 Tax=Paenibacillus sp. ACRRX TaxID=2918206 RepID=UPI001EF5A7AE|nr:hypothetical protein [Paenibacillus sp. ACRRX]MCG7406756.1 hypothetical protein [Paenibacillus sp. ACRRX]
MALLSKEEVKKYYEETKVKAEACGYCCKCSGCAEHMLATELYIWEIDGGGPMFSRESEPNE